MLFGGQKMLFELSDSVVHFVRVFVFLCLFDMKNRRIVGGNIHLRIGQTIIGSFVALK